MATQQLKRTFLVLLAIFSLITVPAQADDTESQIQNGKTLLNEALDTSDRQKLEQAAKIFQALLDKPGFNQSALAVQVSNTAQFYQNAEQHKQSLDWWQRLTKIEPENWRAWAKVVQCSQALGDIKQRDEAREKVIALNKQGKVDQKFFCREQFSSGDKKIMVLEYFVPDTKFGVEMVFRVSPKTEPEVQSRRYTLGEIDSDTQLARELKEIGPDDHMFSIDGFDKRGQWLLKMTTKKPSYEQLREMILADIDKARTGEPSKLKPTRTATIVTNARLELDFLNLVRNSISNCVQNFTTVKITMLKFELLLVTDVNLGMTARIASCSVHDLAFVNRIPGYKPFVIGKMKVCDAIIVQNNFSSRVHAAQMRHP